MLIAVLSPSIFESPVSERLIQKVENATLDKSWIPETDHQRRLKFEREKLKEALRHGTNDIKKEQESCPRTTHPNRSVEPGRDTTILCLKFSFLKTKYST